MQSYFNANSQAVPTISITNWQNNKKAAVCVTLDDGCDQQFAVGKHIMDSLGIKGTFFIITDLAYNCDGGQVSVSTIYSGKGSPGYWDTLQTIIDNGHEIGAHTVHHPNLDSIFSNYSSDSVAKEIYMSKAALEAALSEPGQSATPYNVLTFAYPYGTGQDNPTIIDTVQNYFIAARAAGTPTYTKTWDTYNDANPHNTGFINYFYQVESYAITDTLTISWFTKQLNNTIQYSGWFNPMYHNIGGSSLDADFYSISPANFRLQMEAIAGMEQNLWVAPFKDVARYMKENINSSATIKFSNNSKVVISLTSTIQDKNFNVPLTLLLSNFNCSCVIDSIIQAGEQLTYTKNTNTEIQFNAVPNAGDIAIYTGTNVTSIYSASVQKPFELGQNIPNPASAYTTIPYYLDQMNYVSLELWDTNGRVIKTLVNEEQDMGTYSYLLNLEQIQPGVYFYKLASGSHSYVKKMVVIR